MSTATLVRNVSGAAGPAINASENLTGTVETRIDSEQVADSSTVEIIVAVDVSALKLIYILSDQDVVLETNSDGAPDETFTLLAGKPYIWELASYFTNLLATDITSLFFTNGSGSTATIDMIAVSDGTPA